MRRKDIKGDEVVPEGRRDGRREGVRARKRLEMHEEDCVTGRRGFRVWGKILDASTTLGTTTVAV
jgi:hypothetical protein